ncbi:hypothetical protein [Amycolatopsis dendrobii]|uniref:Uncharacterized protein n=1 Tax=Amycolatopsis dendrobii TaxID=2760662 RepID=A0A7W3ZBJ5_9PSEU|nr:hypothetical protein [Amycolatopsis dendrobii]MBB1154889.1 hypothetical protein [Amycolatopsis dendrobii]
MPGQRLALGVDCPEPTQLVSCCEHQAQGGGVPIAAASGGEPRSGFRQVSDRHPP